MSSSGALMKRSTGSNPTGETAFASTPSKFQPKFSAAVLAVLLTCHTPVQAAFLDGGWGARPVGMGGAFTAIADDTNAPLFNPAGISQVEWNEVSAMYARLFSGLTLYSGNVQTGGDEVHLDQSYLAFVSKAAPKLGSFGLSWTNFNTTHLYREDTVTLSYGVDVGEFIPDVEKALAVGLNVKYLRRSLSLDAATAGDPVFASGSSASAFTVDAGLLYKPDEGPLADWRVGLAAKNLTQPDVGFRDKDTVPLEWRLGLAYQSRQRPWLVPALDFTRRNHVTGVHGGVESWLFGDTLGLRAGGNRDEAAAGLSYYQAVSKSFGFRLDYGFTIPFHIEGTSGSHRVQGTVYF
jgi:hypothetical protein